MSISQIKRKFEQFEVYLGRDTVGLARLKSLKDAVNELRTSLAAAEAKAKEETEAAAGLAQIIRELRRDKDDADLEIHRLRQIVSNLERGLRVAQATLPAETLADHAQSGELDAKRAIKRLRKRLSFCPKPTRMSGELGRMSVPGLRSKWADVYSRESLAAGWSSDALWTLGAAVAVLAYMRGVAVIESTNELYDHGAYDPNLTESAFRPTFQWFAKNNVDAVALTAAAEYDCPGSTGGYEYSANQGGIGLKI